MLELAMSFRRDGFELDLECALAPRIAAVFGPSGSGKTTLLDLIAGLLRPDRGWIRLDGETLFDRAAGVDLPPERRRLGYLFQEGGLFPHLSVEGNLRYGLRRRRAPGPDFGEVIEVLEIGALLARKPAKLSAGEKQRAALGRAILAGPRLLLLDEPLASLDAALKERILPFLGRTVEHFRIPMLYVSHDADELQGFADELLILEEGRLAGRGTPDLLLSKTDKKK